MCAVVHGSPVIKTHEQVCELLERWKAKKQLRGGVRVGGLCLWRVVAHLRRSASSRQLMCRREILLPAEHAERRRFCSLCSAWSAGRIWMCNGEAGLHCRLARKLAGDF